MCDVDDDKPFVCSALDCGMRFTNEDHLHVHMKKHEMCLALNPGGHNSSPGMHILDQTPTPTKFLKNCEEMGLFQELNKNPFEEAFKKASDSDGIPIPGPQSNELNTPVPPPLHDKSHGSFLLHEAAKGIQSPTSSSGGLLKQDSIVLPSKGFALDLSGQRVKEKVSMQPSSTTTEHEEVSVISIADSTQSPSKTVPSSLPAVSTREVVVTQAVSSSLAGSTAGGTQMILTSPATAPQPVMMAQQVLTTTTAQQQQQRPSSASPSQGQQSCTMQVYLQLPTGQTVPVHIPATISTMLPGVTTEQQPHQQQAQQVMVAAPTQPQPNRIAMRQTVTPPPASSNSSMALKQRLKQTLQAQQQQQQQQLQQLQQQQRVVSSSSPRSDSDVSKTMAEEDMSPLMELDSPLSDFNISDLEPMSKRPKNGSIDSEDPDERRRKFLERNRAAAARCRQKRKHWIGNLEKKADELQQTNTKLQTEVSLLRGEVAQLKTLLLAHQDCPITLQQKSQGQIALHAISMVESTTNVPFEMAQLVNAGNTNTVTIDGHQVGAIVSDTNTFTLAPATNSSAK
ncbi:cyclic AMP-dependent transcription factor ATF-7-like isoform X2 [Littorina saxatilis]|uniref:Cyclic AMP-dependent transcription factor ATF-2 n=2 Tax=Littorina saxatilis TaxID=31220 RepID=A0AAN9G238_9CAEN